MYHQYENPDVPCTLRMNPYSPDFFPAMPDDLFDEAMYRVVQRKLLQAIQPKYYERSLVKRYRITTVEARTRARIRSPTGGLVETLKRWYAKLLH